jgi:glutathione S-transferase
MKQTAAALRDGKLKLTAAEKKGGRAALDAITQVLGRGGKHWIHGDYVTLADGLEAFCLSGAAAKANGKYEYAARAAIAAAIAARHATTPQIKPIRIEDAITDFNDASTWADVRHVLTSAKKMLT